jgi:hypothetical protein
MRTSHLLMVTTMNAVVLRGVVYGIIKQLAGC